MDPIQNQIDMEIVGTLEVDRIIRPQIGHHVSQIARPGRLYWVSHLSDPKSLHC